MLRPLRVLLVVVLVLFAAGAFTASAPADDDDDDGGSSPRLVDFTFGDGTADFGVGSPSDFHFNVRSGPQGQAVMGEADLTSVFGFRFFGPATCLNVEGQRAVFEVDNRNPDTILMGDVRVFVGDFGPAGAGDEYNFHVINPLTDGVADTTCPATEGQSNRPTIDGDIVVANDVPAPSDDDEDEDDEDEDDNDDDG